MFVFGAGVLIGTRTDIPDSTPVNFGLVNEVDFDISFTNKMLFGQSKYPIAVGQGTAKFGGKAKMARWSSLALSSLFFGVDLESGQIATAIGEAATLTGTAPVTLPTNGSTASAATVIDFTNTTGITAGQEVTVAGVTPGTTVVSVVVNTSVTISAATTAIIASGTAVTFSSASAPTNTVANAVNFDSDQGVLYAVTGEPFFLVASGPQEGEYSVNTTTGVYTFNGADAGQAILTTYTYNKTGSTGSIMRVTNTLLGVQPTFSGLFYTSFQNVPMTMKVFNCVSNKFSMGTKLEDFTLPEIDFDIYASPSGDVAELSFGDNF